MSKRTLSEVIKDLKSIAQENNLTLNKVEDFVQAVVILDEQNKLNVDTLKTKEV